MINFKEDYNKIAKELKNSSNIRESFAPEKFLGTVEVFKTLKELPNCEISYYNGYIKNIIVKNNNGDIITEVICDITSYSKAYVVEVRDCQGIRIYDYRLEEDKSYLKFLQVKNNNIETILFEYDKEGNCIEIEKEETVKYILTNSNSKHDTKTEDIKELYGNKDANGNIFYVHTTEIKKPKRFEKANAYNEKGIKIYEIERKFDGFSSPKNVIHSNIHSSLRFSKKMPMDIQYGHYEGYVELAHKCFTINGVRIKKEEYSSGDRKLRLTETFNYDNPNDIFSELYSHQLGYVIVIFKYDKEYNKLDFIRISKNEKGVRMLERCCKNGNIMDICIKESENSPLVKIRKFYYNSKDYSGNIVRIDHMKDGEVYASIELDRNSKAMKKVDNSEILNKVKENINKEFNFK